MRKIDVSPELHFLGITHLLRPRTENLNTTGQVSLGWLALSLPAVDWASSE